RRAARAHRRGRQGQTGRRHLPDGQALRDGDGHLAQSRLRSRRELGGRRRSLARARLALMNARIWMERAALFILFVFVAIPRPSPPTIALVLGVLYGITVRHPYPKQAKRLSTWLLQISIVAMGFDMNLQRVIDAGRSGFIYTLFGIAFAMIVGHVLGRLLKVG